MKLPFCPQCGERNLHYLTTPMNGTFVVVCDDCFNLLTLNENEFEHYERYRPASVGESQEASS